MCQSVRFEKHQPLLKYLGQTFFYVTGCNDCCFQCFSLESLLIINPLFYRVYIPQISRLDLSDVEFLWFSSVSVSPEVAIFRTDFFSALGNPYTHLAVRPRGHKIFCRLFPGPCGRFPLYSTPLLCSSNHVSHLPLIPNARSA